MGLAAFDMPAFEAAQEAFTARPRAVTTIFTQRSRDGSASASREDIVKSGDAVVSEFERWKAGTLLAIARMRKLLNESLFDQSLSIVSIVSVRLGETIQSMREHKEEFARIDIAGSEEVGQFIRARAGIDSKTRRFLLKQHRKVAKIGKGRSKTHDHAIGQFVAFKRKVDDFIEANSFTRPSFESDEARDAYMDAALTRAPDSQGVAERTAKRLKQFPKVTAYLAR